MKVYWIIGYLFLILLLPTPFTAQAASDATQRTLALKAGGAGIAFAVNSENGLQGGYATATVDGGSAPFATAIMSYTQDGVVISEVGIPATSPTLSARVFVDFRTHVLSGDGTVDINTGIALVNMGNDTTQITMVLRDLQGGTTLASGMLQLDAKAQLSGFIDQFDPYFVLPSSFSSAIKFGTLEITGNQPISVLAMRMTMNQRGEPLFAGMPFADLTNALSNSPLNFPQIADGSGYQTTLLLVNASDEQESGTICFMKDDGSPYQVRLNQGNEPVSQFHYSIETKGALRILTDGSPSETTAGWAQLMPDDGNHTPVGAGIIGLISGGILTTESSAPSAAPTTHARMYIDCSSNHETGLAVVALDNKETNVTVQAYQLDGITGIGNGPINIQLHANGHRADFVNQLIAELPSGFTGILDMQSSTPFAALTLRSMFNSRNDFLITAFPMADYDSPAPVPAVFPQIAAGDGYQTEIVFLNTGEETNVTLSFAGEDGSLLQK